VLAPSSSAGSYAFHSAITGPGSGSSGVALDAGSNIYTTGTDPLIGSQPGVYRKFLPNGSGPDSDADTQAGNTVFMRQGIFVP
jgi:hypothetical protein